MFLCSSKKCVRDVISVCFFHSLKYPLKISLLKAELLVTLSPAKARIMGVMPRSLVKLGRDGFLTKEQSLFIKNFFPDAFRKASERTIEKRDK